PHERTAPRPANARSPAIHTTAARPSCRRLHLLPARPLSEVARLEGDLVHVAPGPLLAGLEGADDGVRRHLEVLRRMTVWRGVTAADVATGTAEPQMDPAVAALEA